jgi:LuxR family transcriptional regulator, quorum-sensing system regulator BjaR1
MIQNRALQFIDTVSRHLTVGRVLQSMGKALNSIGVNYFCMNLLPTPKQQFAEVMLASELPSDWLNLYTAKGYVEFDPSQRYGKRVVDPYEWKDAPYDPECEPGALEVIHRARDFGIGTGFVVPIPGSAGNIGNVWMGGYNFQIMNRHKPSLHLMALYAFAHVQRLNGTVRQNVTLNDREREILTWIAAGKSTIEIGEILSLSDRTVEWHVKRSIVKLGARTRTNAVVVALREGIIAF